MHHEVAHLFYGQENTILLLEADHNSSSSSHSHCRHTARPSVRNEDTPFTVVLHLMLFKEMGRPIAPHTRTLLTALQLWLLFCLNLQLLCSYGL